jgi:hypothetical protein
MDELARDSSSFQSKVSRYGCAGLLSTLIHLLVALQAHLLKARCIYPPHSTYGKHQPKTKLSLERKYEGLAFRGCPELKYYNHFPGDGKLPVE